MYHWPLRASTPLQSILWPIIDPILVTFEQIFKFRDLNLVTFYFFLIDHVLDWMKNTSLFIYNTKHSGTFANRKYEELFYPKEAENVRPHLSLLEHFADIQVPLFRTKSSLRQILYLLTKNRPFKKRG